MSGLRLGAAQTVAVAGDVAANVEQHLRLVRLAAPARPDVVLFPELSLTGYEIEIARSLAFAEDDKRLLPVVEAAARHSTMLIVGAPVLSNGVLHIGAFVVAPDGSVDLYGSDRQKARRFDRAACPRDTVHRRRRPQGVRPR